MLNIFISYIKKYTSVQRQPVVKHHTLLIRQVGANYIKVAGHGQEFVSDLGQVGGFLWVLRFPPPIKLTAMI
jgi:hypothetical protein